MVLSTAMCNVSVVSNISRAFGFHATTAPWVQSANGGGMFMYFRVDRLVPAICRSQGGA